MSKSAKVGLLDARLYTLPEHKPFSRFQRSLERLHLLIPGSALTAVTTAIPLLSKSSFQIFISNKGIVVTPGV